MEQVIFKVLQLKRASYVCKIANSRLEEVVRPYLGSREIVDHKT